MEVNDAILTISARNDGEAANHLSKYRLTNIKEQEDSGVHSAIAKIVEETREMRLRCTAGADRESTRERLASHRWVTSAYYVCMVGTDGVSGVGIADRLRGVMNESRSPEPPDPDGGGEEPRWRTDRQEEGRDDERRRWRWRRRRR